MSKSDEAGIIGGIVTEHGNGGESSSEAKARNRMVAEGYRYKALAENGDGELHLDPIEDRLAEKQRKRWRRLMFLIIVALLLIVCLVVVIVIQHAKLSEASGSKHCVSEECVKGAAYILNKMDPSVDPCQDFYTFSCGGWEGNTPLPPSKSKYGSFTQISEGIEKMLKEIMSEEEAQYKGVFSKSVHKAKAYYKMCNDVDAIEEAGVTPALKLINTLGGWTLTSDPVSGTFDPATWTVLDALILSHRQKLSPLFSMGLETDMRNSSVYVIGFSQSGLSLGDSREYFPNHTNYQALQDAFIKFGKDVVGILGGKDEVDRKITDIYNFEKELAFIRVPREELVDPSARYHRMTLQAFQDNYLSKDWIEIDVYMDGIFRDIQNITMDTEVVVATPAYFKRLGDLLKNTSAETLANYIVWHGIQSYVGYLTKDIIAAALEMDKVESGIKEYPAQWKRCLGKVNGVLGFAVGALYVEKHFAEGSKQEVESLFEDIRSAFIANLDSLTWMDKETRDYAKEKAHGVTKMLGYPDFILDPEELDRYYENLTLVEGDYFGSRLAISAFYKEKNLQKYGTVPNRTEWDMIPTEVNGYYSSDFNHIVFPAGILQPPLYNPTSPKAFNYGSFGMICGHELTHGFDNKGREFDKNGNMRNWWTNSSSENFEKRSQCFVDYYNNFTVSGTNHIDGKTTLSENIADNGGMKTAYQAFQLWKANNKEDDLILPGVKYTQEQLFFIGMSQIWCSHYTPAYQLQAILIDDHSIAKYRVLGPMANSEYFAQAFNCPVGSPMNPKEKCNVW